VAARAGAGIEPAESARRLTFIHRFGIKDIEQRLPEMIQAGARHGSDVLWVCDPMHGNTETTAGGLKTRRFDNILVSGSGVPNSRESGSMLGVCISNSPARMSPNAWGARGLAKPIGARLQIAGRSPLNAEQALELGC